MLSWKILQEANQRSKLPYLVDPLCEEGASRRKKISLPNHKLKWNDAFHNLLGKRVSSSLHRFAGFAQAAFYFIGRRDLHYSLIVTSGSSGMDGEERNKIRAVTIRLII